MTAEPATVAQSETLDVALGHLSDHRVSTVAGHRPQAIVRVYRNQVNEGLRELRGLASTSATSSV